MVSSCEDTWEQRQCMMKRRAVWRWQKLSQLAVGVSRERCLEAVINSDQGANGEDQTCTPNAMLYFSVRFVWWIFGASGGASLVRCEVK